MKIAYIVWRDANHGIVEIHKNDFALCELHEIGFVAHETEEHITLTIEHDPNSSTPDEFRLWLTIPKVNIVRASYLEPKKIINEKRRSRSKGKDRLEGRKPRALRAMPPPEVRNDSEPVLRRPGHDDQAV